MIDFSEMTPSPGSDVDPPDLAAALAGKSPVDQAKIRAAYKAMKMLEGAAEEVLMVPPSTDAADDDYEGCGDPDCEECGSGSKAPDPAKLAAKAMRDAARARASAAVGAAEGLSEQAKRALAAAEMRSPIVFGSGGGGSLWDDD
jgi:hypothetical protein